MAVPVDWFRMHESFYYPLLLCSYRNGIATDDTSRMLCLGLAVSFKPTFVVVAFIIIMLALSAVFIAIVVYFLFRKHVCFT